MQNISKEKYNSRRFAQQPNGSNVGWSETTLLCAQFVDVVFLVVVTAVPGATLLSHVVVVLVVDAVHGKSVLFAKEQQQSKN